MAMTLMDNGIETVRKSLKSEHHIDALYEFHVFGSLSSSGIAFQQDDLASTIDQEGWVKDMLSHNDCIQRRKDASLDPYYL